MMRVREIIYENIMLCITICMMFTHLLSFSVFYNLRVFRIHSIQVEFILLEISSYLISFFMDYIVVVVRKLVYCFKLVLDVIIFILCNNLRLG